MFNIGISRKSLARFGFEGMLIVVSILIAFSIDAWWEERQQERLRAELVQSLQQDFRATRGRLETAITSADSLIERSTSFLNAVAEGKDESLPALRHNMGGAFRKIDFEPTLPAYDSAVATGQIALLDSPAFFEVLAEFHQAHRYYGLHDRIAAEIYYVGPVWELRKSVGSLRVLFRDPERYPVHFRRSDEEYRRIYYSPLAYAAIETMVTAQRNSANGLRRMQEQADLILQELERL